MCISKDGSICHEAGSTVFVTDTVTYFYIDHGKIKLKATMWQNDIMDYRPRHRHTHNIQCFFFLVRCSESFMLRALMCSVLCRHILRLSLCVCVCLCVHACMCVFVCQGTNQKSEDARGRGGSWCQKRGTSLTRRKQRLCQPFNRCQNRQTLSGEIDRRFSSIVNSHTCTK